ncbi:hypothetical protein [Sediminibacterium salmoneum]|uniref:hypothetical protein n=1 Tax=Sediminibacterium salmoneum TaxID=426421 RepID=UPI00047A0981|nr:hypothetical protein [Sediminibacterium salmoneum]
MAKESTFSEQESLQLIAEMIKKAKGSYHDTGIGSLLWGAVVAIASGVNFLQREYDFKLGFDIWWLVLAAIIPQVYLSIREKKIKKAKQYDDDLIDSVWLVFGISIFAMGFYQNIVPAQTEKIIAQEGWTMMKHYADGRPDEVIRPFTPSLYSVYILLYAFPTMVTAMVKKFVPMKIGAIITYGLFILSLFTESRYDMLLGSMAALVCWFIPGIILRKKYLRQAAVNV